MLTSKNYQKGQGGRDFTSSSVFLNSYAKLLENDVKGRPCGSGAQLAECSHGKPEALGSSPDRATSFSAPVTFGGSVWVRGKGNEHQKVHVSFFLRCSKQTRGRI